MSGCAKYVATPLKSYPCHPYVKQIVEAYKPGDMWSFNRIDTTYVVECLKGHLIQESSTP